MKEKKVRKLRQTFRNISSKMKQRTVKVPQEPWRHSNTVTTDTRSRCIDTHCTEEFKNNIKCRDFGAKKAEKHFILSFYVLSIKKEKDIYGEISIITAAKNHGGQMIKKSY